MAAWASGHYLVIGTTLQIVGGSLCETLDLRAGERVLDVVGGNGNASLSAARRFADVTCTDYVPALLDRAQERAAAERLAIDFRPADAEALPFGDASFDVVLSTFGVMFTPDQERAARRAAPRLPPRRPHRAGELDAGQLHRPVVPVARQPVAAAGRPAPNFAVGQRGAARRVVPGKRGGDHAAPLQLPLPLGRPFCGSVPERLWSHKTFAALDEEARPRLEQDILALLREADRGGGRGLAVPSAYLEAVIRPVLRS
jgi:SAM-dependent methyltransferase